MIAASRYPLDSLSHQHSLAFKSTMDFSSVAVVQTTSYGGQSLVATQAIPAPGTRVAKFEGPIVSYDLCSDYDKRYVLLVYNEQRSEWEYMLPLSDARYADHSCDPNCIIDSQLHIVNIKPIRRGEGFSFFYNYGNETEDEWDPIWSFQCCCGSANCQGMIDRYRDIKHQALLSSPAKTGKTHTERQLLVQKATTSISDLTA